MTSRYHIPTEPAPAPFAYPAKFRLGEGDEYAKYGRGYRQTIGEQRMYQQAKGQKIEPPRDDIDQEAIATGREISRYIGGNILRVSRPVILGKGTAANPKCYACHQDKMGINEGEVIGTYSMHYDAKEESETFSFFAWGTIFMAFAVSVVIGWINAFFIKKLAGAPIYQMTEIMNHMAKGNT